MPSIVTKTGDRGMTGIFGSARVSKDSARIQACGAVDELNAAISVVLHAHDELPLDIYKQLSFLQHTLFRLGGDLATPMAVRSKQDRIGSKHVEDIEAGIIALESQRPPQTSFLLPGGTPASAYLHYARTICRRAERIVVTLQREESVNEQALVFLNRLSDYLFLVARKVNLINGQRDVPVEY